MHRMEAYGFVPVLVRQLTATIETTEAPPASVSFRANMIGYIPQLLSACYQPAGCRTLRIVVDLHQEAWVCWVVYL